MSLDVALAAAVADTVRSVLDRELTARLGADGFTVVAPSDDRPLDAHGLIERGYARDEAYALLRAHGVKLPGARKTRIAKSVLEMVERGELPA